VTQSEARENKKMKSFKNLGSVGVLLLCVACGGGAGGAAGKEVKDPSGQKGVGGQEVSQRAAAGFKSALDAFAAQEKSATWSEATCKQVAEQFATASADQKSAGGNDLPEATYNAGLAYQRCGDDINAKAKFEQAYKIDSKFHRARAQLALYRFKDSKDLDAAIRELDQIIRDAEFQNAEALVALAALQMQRGGSVGGQGCNDDLSCAKLNLQRALALDDSFMPAFNQLALYYLEQARSGAGGKGKKRGGLQVASTRRGKVNKQGLDLAALVASQAQKKNPNYAPIHNTTGLILVELENYNGAVKSFKSAVTLSPKFFEAQMNYAAVNLSFRGFAEAEKAYRAALSLRPDTYEAHLGLALALRGGIDDTNFEKNLAEAQQHLDEAKRLEPNRPEAFYNEAILAQEYRAKRAPSEDAQIAEFNKAAAQYQSFIQKAEGKAGFEDAVKVSKDRIQDINDTIKFMKESQAMAAEDARQRAAMEAQRKADEEAAKNNPPADGEGAPPADGAAPPAGGGAPAP
jgi:tetratricopeptide (TPR) repeat protein